MKMYEINYQHPFSGEKGIVYANLSKEDTRKASTHEVIYEMIQSLTDVPVDRKGEMEYDFNLDFKEISRLPNSELETEIEEYEKEIASLRNKIKKSKNEKEIESLQKEIEEYRELMTLTFNELGTEFRYIQ